MKATISVNTSRSWQGGLALQGASGKDLSDGSSGAMGSKEWCRCGVHSPVLFLSLEILSVILPVVPLSNLWFFCVSEEQQDENTVYTFDKSV